MKSLVALCLVCVASGSCTDGRVRRVRYWIGDAQASTTGTVVNATNMSCTSTFMGNLSKYLPAIDSLGLEMMKMKSNGSEVYMSFTNEAADFACLQQIKDHFKDIKVGTCASQDSDPGSLATVAGNPPALAAAVKALVTAHPLVEEFWTDFEIKYVSSAQAEGINKGFALAQAVLPTFRYAGCEPRDPPYFGETCRQFASGAPGVIVQSANTYWSTTVKAGWYGGFEVLLRQEIANIGEDKVSQLSPAICPDCATGADSDNTLSQQQLYDRMDLVCSLGITDLSGFTMTEITALKDGEGVGERYMEAFAYFRTGKKGLIIKTSAEDGASPVIV